MNFRPRGTSHTTPSARCVVRPTYQVERSVQRHIHPNSKPPFELLLSEGEADRVEVDDGQEQVANGSAPETYHR